MCPGSGVVLIVLIPDICPILTITSYLLHSVLTSYLTCPLFSGILLCLCILYVHYFLAFRSVLAPNTYVCPFFSDIFGIVMASNMFIIFWHVNSGLCISYVKFCLVLKSNMPILFWHFARSWHQICTISTGILFDHRMYYVHCFLGFGYYLS